MVDDLPALVELCKGMLRIVTLNIVPYVGSPNWNLAGTLFATDLAEDILNFWIVTGDITRIGGTLHCEAEVK